MKKISEILPHYNQFDSITDRTVVNFKRKKKKKISRYKTSDNKTANSV